MPAFAHGRLVMDFNITVSRSALHTTKSIAIFRNSASVCPFARTVERVDLIFCWRRQSLNASHQINEDGQLHSSIIPGRLRFIGTVAKELKRLLAVQFG